MDINVHQPPRTFSPYEGLELHDMGDICLGLDEQVTFITRNGKTNDVTRKDWGYYLTNSLNANLSKQGLKTALMMSPSVQPSRFYIALVEAEYMESFLTYMKKYGMTVAAWLDEWVQPPFEQEGER